MTTVRSGTRGRPRKIVDEDLVAEAMQPRRNISVSKLSCQLNISRHTLRKNMEEYGVSHGFDLIPDDELDAMVSGYKTYKPASGQRYTIAWVRSQGLRIQRRRIQSSLHRVDGIGQALRKRAIIHRRVYETSRPNALWHLDGHHKLIQWGVVIHGCIDGNCRTVCAVHSCLTSQALTVPRWWASEQAPTTCRQRYWSYSWKRLPDTGTHHEYVATVEERTLMSQSI